MDNVELIFEADGFYVIKHKGYMMVNNSTFTEYYYFDFPELLPDFYKIFVKTFPCFFDPSIHIKNSYTHGCFFLIIQIITGHRHRTHQTRFIKNLQFIFYIRCPKYI